MNRSVGFGKLFGFLKRVLAGQVVRLRKLAKFSSGGCKEATPTADGTGVAVPVRKQSGTTTRGGERSTERNALCTSSILQSIEVIPGKNVSDLNLIYKQKITLKILYQVQCLK